MTDLNLFKKILSVPKTSEESSLYKSLSLIKDYGGDVELLTNDKGRLYYKTDFQPLLDNDITENDIMILNNCSWKIEEGTIMTKDF